MTLSLASPLVAKGCVNMAPMCAPRGPRLKQPRVRSDGKNKKELGGCGGRGGSGARRLRRACWF